MQDGQFVISYQLIRLLQWMMEHDSDKFKKMIRRALLQGLADEMRADHLLTEAEALNNAHEVVIAFFASLEQTLAEALDEQVVKQAMEHNLMPAIEHFDISALDDMTLKSSVEKATAKMDENPQSSPHDLLFQELLKRWKPDKKNLIN